MFFSARCARPHHTARKVGLQVESLEDRQLLASGITATFANGVLNITGTSKADNIVVRQDGDKVTVDGFKTPLSASQIQAIRIDGGDGNDKIQLSVSDNLTRKTSVRGGGGTDTLTYPKDNVFGSFDGFEKYAYGAGAKNLAAAKSNAGQVASSVVGQSQQTAGWYFEVKSGMVGIASDRFGPFQTRQEADQRLNARLEMFEGSRSAIVRDVYYVSGTSGSTTTAATKTTTASKTPVQPAVNSGWGYAVTGTFNNQSVSYTDNGYQYSANVGYFGMGIDGSVSISGNPFPALPFVGSASFSPSSTVLGAGVGYNDPFSGYGADAQVTYTFPYGYMNAYSGIGNTYNATATAVGQWNSPVMWYNWMNQMYGGMGMPYYGY